MALSVERLRSLLRYDPESGYFTRLTSKGAGRAGERSASLDSRGYVQVRADGQRYRGHRLAWFYMTGRWPVGPIDHINGIRNDNRWFNLREATPAQNSQNMRARDNSRSGFKGVTWKASERRWRARITWNGQQHFLGYFDTAEAAAAAYSTAADRLFGDFAKS